MDTCKSSHLITAHLVRTFLRTAYQLKGLFLCSLSCSPIAVNHMVTLKVTHKRAFSLVTNLGNQNFLLTNLLTIPQ